MSVQRSVILHTGLHKTATSSIQRTLANNRDVLCANGIHYGHFTNCNGLDQVNHSLPLRICFSEKYHQHTYFKTNTLDHEQERERFWSELNLNLETLQTVVFSGEGISKLSRVELMQLRVFFEERAFAIRPICFVRSPYSMTCSSRQENIKAGRKEQNRHEKSMPIVRRLRSVFPEMQFRSFQQACRHEKGPVGFFLDNVGLGALGDIQYHKANKGLSDQAVRLILGINEIMPALLGKQRASRKMHDTLPFWHIPGEKYLLLESEFAQVEKAIREENSEMCSDLGSEYCDEHFPTHKTLPEWEVATIKAFRKVFPKIEPTLGLAAYYYLAVNQLITEDDLTQLRVDIATKAHEEMRLLVADNMVVLQKQMEEHHPDKAARLGAAAFSPLI